MKHSRNGTIISGNRGGGKLVRILITVTILYIAKKRFNKRSTVNDHKLHEKFFREDACQLVPFVELRQMIPAAGFAILLQMSTPA